MNNFYFHGGPTWLEWVAGLCDKVNELITAINNIYINGVKNPHKLTFTGDVDATYDGSEDVTVDISGGGGGGGESDKLWYPYIVEKVLNWRKTTSTTTPTPFDLNQLKGEKGSDGYSPTANVKQTATGATITITDKTGTTTAKVKNGTDGTNGTNGIDGFSPSAKVTPTEDGARITITDKTGTTTADVTNGVDGSDGATGPAGRDGAPGAAAGFGTVDATATTGTTAGARVTTDGPDTAKNMHFAFTIPTGGGGGGSELAYKRIRCNLSYDGGHANTIEASSVLVTVYGRIVVVQGKFYTSGRDNVYGLVIEPINTGDTLPDLESSTTISGYPVPAPSGLLSMTESYTYNITMSKSDNSYTLTINTFAGICTIVTQPGQVHTTTFVAIGFTKA
jgi:hypothetical protein|nr:MAG TPA: hypothetical protein [Caudoviricetes sp.]